MTTSPGRAVAPSSGFTQRMRSSGDHVLAYSRTSGRHSTRSSTHTVAPRDATALSVSLAFAADAEWTDAAPPPLRTWTYVRVTQKDGEMAWSSPVWLGPRAAK